ncbi:MAG: DUF4381 domain-containing protein [Planctomycetota bacterium]
MKAPDPYSLDRMADIVMPPRVPLWPPAGIWYFALALMTLWGSVFLKRKLSRFLGDSYRRQALVELRSINQGDYATLSVLLKRVAMVSFRTEEVASLVGADWIDFLKDSCSRSQFDSPVKDQIANATTLGPTGKTDSSVWRSAVQDATAWIKHHQSEPHK